MKQLLNDDLTNHKVFEVYDAVVEPVICDLFAALGEGDIPYIEVWDDEGDLTEDYGNEHLILFKVGLLEGENDNWERFMVNETPLSPTELQKKLNQVLDEYVNPGDFLMEFTPIILMNYNIVIPFTMQK